MKNLNLYDKKEEKLLSLKEASLWASQYLNKKITVSNISYLIQYGRIKKYGSNSNPLVDVEELKSYYDSRCKERHWKDKLGEDINWHLSFEQYKQSERTKHVHGIHPYKGKFIPQLVEYFLDKHTDQFKKHVYFREGDIVLDPFCGSGTTLVQANELGIHAIGIDVSYFNSLIANVKVEKHNIPLILQKAQELTLKLKEFQKGRKILEFEKGLSGLLAEFNSKFFPSPEYKRLLANKSIDEKTYSKEKEKEFLLIYEDLVRLFNIKVKQDKDDTFLDKWYAKPVREELEFLANEIKKIEDKDVKNLLTIILSRTARSCRATTHSDLATLKQPIVTPYYCKKHKKICRPLYSITKWWEFYIKDTIKRLEEFEKLRTNTYQVCLTGDSRNIDIYQEVKKVNPEFAELILRQGIKGIFSSPPYVGLINYHEQHAYAYEIFGFERRDDLEIGPLSRGQTADAQRSYVEGIAQVLLNCKKYLQRDYDIFLVANDKFNLYPQIAQLAGMKIVEQFKRPVLNRVEKDRETPYSETIFHLKEK